MHTSSASHLNLYELLEPILLQLPIRDIFIAQAVCTTWQKVIQRSRKLQENMFLRPSTKPLIALPDARAEKAPQWCATVFETPRIVLNPLSRFSRSDDYDAYYQPHRPFRELVASAMKHRSDPRFLFSITGFWPPGDSTEHSWRTMLLTQPPITAVDIIYTHGYGLPRAFNRENEKGVTLGDLHEWMQALDYPYRNCSTDVCWWGFGIKDAGTELLNGLTPEESHSDRWRRLLRERAGE